MMVQSVQRVKRLSAAVLAAFVVASAVSCGGEATAPTPTVTGVWNGGSNANVFMSLTLTQAGSTVSGNGRIEQTSSVHAVTASGTMVGATVSLTLTTQGFEPMNFTGQVADTQINGVLNGSGFANVALQMFKLPQ